ncbi:Mitotic spindle checkpoint protein Mad2 [Gracilaria domingensis]|nr:Mitotic spindle checkpoint protein Mad2 [Gracilaria domingensis]
MSPPPPPHASPAAAAAAAATAAAAAASPAAEHSISLSGSADLVADFFSYGVNTLLYLRGVYPPETFSPAQKYGVTVYLTTDPDVQRFLQNVLTQMRTWLHSSSLRRVVVVIASAATKKVLERWAFDVNVADGAQQPSSTGSKKHATIMAEIQAIIRQISASVAFLPILDEACSFDMLIYTDKSIQTPAKWQETGPRIIPNAQQVTLRSFSTSVHDVSACVSYSMSDD